VKSRDPCPWSDSGCTFLQVRIGGVGFTPCRSDVGLVLYCRSILHFMKKIKSLQEVLWHIWGLVFMCDQDSVYFIMKQKRLY
jgi:hypothetical protein